MFFLFWLNKKTSCRSCTRISERARASAHTRFYSLTLQYIPFHFTYDDMILSTGKIHTPNPISPSPSQNHRYLYFIYKMKIKWNEQQQQEEEEANKTKTARERERKREGRAKELVCNIKCTLEKEWMSWANKLEYKNTYQGKNLDGMLLFLFCFVSPAFLFLSITAFDFISTLNFFFCRKIKNAFNSQWFK